MATAQVSQTQKRQTTDPARIIGQGTLAGKHGLPFVLVTSSSEPGRVHVVSYSYEGAYVGARMHCDCVAASYGKHCRHCALVARWLEQGLAALGLPYTAEAETPQAGQTARASANVHPSQAPPAPRASGSSRVSVDERDTAILRRSNRPFSLLK